MAGNAATHTPGQKLYGDALVVGASPRTLDQDVTGEVWHVGSLADLAKFELAEAAAPAVEPSTPPEPEPAPEAEPEAETEPADDLDTMNRVDLIQHAAAEWPGQERWANMANDVIKRYIRNRRNEA